jgi:hypothetical protein
MKLSTMLSAAALSIAVAGLAGSATAQVRTEPAGKLFFEGDIVLHAEKGLKGPFCVLDNRFMRGEGVAWRVRVMLPDGQVADTKAVKSVQVVLGNGETLPLRYGGHGMPATDFFWSTHWDIPMDFPTGSLGYKVIATMNDGTQVTWTPFNRPPSQLTIITGEPEKA